MVFRCIVVIAENLTQFNDYVESVKHSKIKIYERPGHLKIEALEFLWVRSAYNMMGYTFSEDSELVKIGSWYNLPKEEIKIMEEYFESRKVK